MADNHGVQTPGNFSGPGPEVIERHRVAKERAAQRVRRWTAQSEMGGVLGRMSAGAARRILDSANFTEMRAQQKAVFVAPET